MWRAERDEARKSDGGWTVTDHLLARIADLVDDNFRASLIGKVKGELPKPRRTPRPNDRKPEPIGWRAVSRRLHREVSHG